jgi:ketosteroid isomerase-like protein
VATFGRYKCTLKKTGKHVDSPVAHLFKFRDGKIVRFVDHLNTAAFLEAAQSNAVGR